MIFPAQGCSSGSHDQSDDGWQRHLHFTQRHAAFTRPGAGVQAHLHSVQHIQSTTRAFAAIRSDGQVVAWGDPAAGGDCSKVQEHLKNVQQIQATDAAFAAILADA